MACAHSRERARNARDSLSWSKTARNVARYSSDCGRSVLERKNVISPRGLVAVGNQRRIIGCACCFGKALGARSTRKSNQRARGTFAKAAAEMSRRLVRSAVMTRVVRRSADCSDTVVNGAIVHRKHWLGECKREPERKECSKNPAEWPQTHAANITACARASNPVVRSVELETIPAIAPANKLVDRHPGIVPAHSLGE